jgi:hypothetical protein
MITKHWYRAHGLVVASCVELPLPPGPAVQCSPDLVLRRGGDRLVPDDDPPGRRLAALRRSDGTVLYILTRDGCRTVLRYPGLCEFVGDGVLGDITVHLQPGADPGLIPVLMAGAVLAVHLRLRSELVLHASAVRRAGRALAFVGASGMGKSTLAAALCHEGCDLVSDDVLRVDLADPATVHVYPGSTENRLRTNARQLTDAAPPDAVRATADGRLALRPPACADGPLPLAACIVPLPRREASAVSVHELPHAGALLRMIRFPRIVGWIEPVSIAREFQALADLVERVPVFEAEVPWGPPFRPEVLSGLLDAVTRGTSSEC